VTAVPELWSCPGDDWAPTENPPIELPAVGDEVEMVLCGGECGREHPKSAVKRVPSA
jgi:hypothetical protein